MLDKIKNLKFRGRRPATLFVSLVLGVAIGWTLSMPPSDVMARFAAMSIGDKHETLTAMRDAMWRDLLPIGKYACCLEKPCTTCAILDKYHGEGPTCTCLEDVVEGEPPCGECVGGIIGGRGNRFIAKNFARSLADGERGPYYEALRNIVAEEYGVAIEDQM